MSTLEIDAVGQRGDGVAAGADGPIYVPCTLPGERVEVEDWPGHPDRRQLLTVEQPSPERIAPICPHFGVCGGCALQHWASAPYRAWKRGLVIEALHQAGIEAPVAELIDAHGDGRRRAVFHARRGTHDVLEVGFSAARAHHVVAIDRCPILAKSLDGALAAAWAIAERLGAMAKPLDIGVTATDTGLDVDVRGSGPLTARATGGAGARRRGAKAGAPDAPRRAHRAGARADAADRHGDSGAAARRIPAGNRRRRSGAGPAGARHLRRRQKHGRPVRRRRAVRAAARGKGTHCRG